MQKKVFLPKIALLLVLCVVMGACGGGTTPPAEGSSGGANAAPAGMKVTAVEDTLTIGHRGEPTSLDPPSQNNSPSGKPIIQMYDGLIEPDNETGGIKPCLAETWEQVDSVTVRFHLRQGVTSHNGDPFTAYDVKYSVERGVASTYKQYVWGGVDAEATNVIDDYTIDIVMKEPDAAFLKKMSDPGASMVVKASVEAAGGEEAHGRNPIGATGPFRFKEWIAGDRVVMERNDDYWGQKPYFKYLVFRNISDDTSRSISLETGEIDICYDVLPAQVSSLEADPSTDIIRYPSMTTTYMAFNTANPPLDKVEVRQALRYALDLDGMCNLAFSGSGSPSDSPLTPANVAYSPASSEDTYTYDVEKAKALLASAGYEGGGFTVRLWTNENQSRIDLAEMIQNAWAKIGVTTDVQILDFGVMQEMCMEGKHDAFIQGFVTMGNDGDFIYSQFHSKGDYNDNRSAYKNLEFDKLIDAARSEFDESKRNEYYAQAQSILRKDMPWIPIHAGENVFGIRATLTGLEKDTAAQPRLKTVKPK